MSLILDSPEETSLGGATGSLPESSESIESKQQKSESESEYVPPYSYCRSVTPPWKLKSYKDIKESDCSVCDDDPIPLIYIHKDFTYMNRAMIEKEKALAEFRKNSVERSAWDADPVPLGFRLCGSIRPYTITEDDRPNFIHYSNLSLDKFNAENQGANFVFDDLVKATKVVCGYTYYITFNATDASNSSGVSQTFWAKVTHDTIIKDAQPIVHLIKLKPMKKEPNTQ